MHLLSCFEILYLLEEIDLTSCNFCQGKSSDSNGIINAKNVNSDIRSVCKARLEQNGTFKNKANLGSAFIEILTNQGTCFGQDSYLLIHSKRVNTQTMQC